MQVMLRLIFLYYKYSMKTKILRASHLKIRQSMKRAIQWFPRVRSDMFERYAAEKLLNKRYYCHQTSFSCEQYMLKTEKILRLTARKIR